MVDHVFKLRRVQPLFTHQVDQHARVDLAAARAHDKTTRWGHSHAGVDRFTVPDRRDAGASAEMGNDSVVSADPRQADAGWIHRKGRGSRSAEYLRIAIPWVSEARGQYPANRYEMSCRNMQSAATPESASVQNASPIRPQAYAAAQRPMRRPVVALPVHRSGNAAAASVRHERHGDR